MSSGNIGGNMKNKGIITILAGIGVLCISFFFSSGYHPKLDIMGNIFRMEIVLRQGHMLDLSIPGEDYHIERVAIPLKYPLSLSVLLILSGTGIVLVSKNKGAS